MAINYNGLWNYGKKIMKKVILIGHADFEAYDKILKIGHVLKWTIGYSLTHKWMEKLVIRRDKTQFLFDSFLYKLEWHLNYQSNKMLVSMSVCRQYFILVQHYRIDPYLCLHFNFTCIQAW